MYKLILVDDEEVEEADYRLEVLDIDEKSIQEIAMATIEMPLKDGLKLSENSTERLSAIKKLILTGFDGVDYAKRSIKLNVIEYVHKPVSSEKLTEIILKIKKQIDREITRKKDMQALRDHYIRSLPILKEKFLSSLITGKLKNTDIHEKSKYFNINLCGQGYVVSIVSIDSWNNNEYGEKPVAAQSENAGYFKLPEEKELLEYAVLNITDEIITKHGLGTAFQHDGNTVVISVCGESDEEVVVSKTISILNEIRQCIEKYLKHSVTIGVGTVCYDVKDLSYSYKNSITALEYRLILGNNRVIYLKDIQPQPVNKIVFDELKERAVLSCIKGGTTRDIKETLDSIFEEIISSQVSFEDCQIYLLEVLVTILKATKDLNLDMSDIMGNKHNLFAELYHFSDIREIKEWFMEICTKVASRVSNDKKSASKLLVEKAKKYIQNHYHESDITINKVCKCLYISPAYFSSIFKKETKMTFMNYLLNVRMNAAKELLRIPDMKTNEIARKIGYSDANYFSYCFKKKFGISPTEYRNSIYK